MGDVEPRGFNPREPIDKEWYTFITFVKYHPGKHPDDLRNYLNEKMQNFKDTIRINLVAVTFGHGDTVIVWQAKEPDDAKKFRDNPSTHIGDFTSMFASKSDIW